MLSIFFKCDNCNCTIPELRKDFSGWYNVCNQCGHDNRKPVVYSDNTKEDIDEFIK